MLNRPAFRADLHVEPLEPSTLFLLSEDRHWVVQGRVYVQLAPLIDGRNTVSDLVTRLAGQVNPPELFVALGRLEGRGYLVEADDAVPAEQAAFWQALGFAPAVVQARFADAPCELRALGAAEIEPLREALHRFGVQTDRPGGPLIVVTDHYLHPALAAINAECLAAGRPWVLLRLLGRSFWIGPAFSPDSTGCWDCLAQRIRANRQLDAYFERKLDGAGPFTVPLAALEGSAEIAAGLAATEIVKWLLKPGASSLHGGLLTFDQISLATEQHHMVRRPQCAACGEPTRFSAYQPPLLRPQPRAQRVEGGYRSVRPEETYARLKHHISPISGVINWLGDVTGGQTHGLTYSYGAGHNFALIQDDAYWLQRNLRSTTGGKGMSELQAKVSAMGEAIERYSGVYRGDEPERRASYRELGDEAVHLHACLNFSPEQYAGRAAWNAREDVGRFHSVPHPFDEAESIAWSPVWSLSSGVTKYVPAAYCYFGHPDTTRFYHCAADGNGNSAGNSLEEAVLQGLLELIERDSTAIWWYNRIPRPAVDLDSFQVPYLDAIQRHYASLGRALWVLDITADLGIPTFAAVSRRCDHPVEDLLIGLGAHLDPQVALLRAITELNQFLPAVSRRKPDASTLYNFPEGEAVTWWTQARIAEHPYLAPSAAPVRRAADYRSLATDDLLDDINSCVAVAAAKGLEVLVLEQTRPDIGMPVAKVIVPGLRHFWRRTGPGRLYDVPVQLGWLQQPSAEQALNPYSIFF
jgi:ribosomal protein S12 methylthiotransferase accessory factor